MNDTYIFWEMGKMNRDQKIQIWEATKHHYAAQAPQDSVVIDGLDREAYRSSVKRFPKTTVHWENADCVDVAIFMKQVEGLNPMLLNMASDFQPGGGVGKGASAQEEELFRRSNYFKFLHRRWYPFPGNRVIVSKGVEFYRASAEAKYVQLPTPVLLDCIAVAGIRRPECTADWNRFKHASDVGTLRTRLRMLMLAAYQNGNDSLVLSALGCGAFQGPIQHIAEIFAEILEETEGWFQEVTFAILGSNFAPFKQGFEGYVGTRD